jgi:ubiquinone/menaquinone biosynthesis C-methylase UbiE
MRVLDIGCGAGDVSFLAADFVGPTGSVIGVDRSSDAVAVATSRATIAGLRNVRFQSAELDEMMLDAPADALVGRLVLMYSPAPVRTLRQLLTQVRSGGIVALHEFDMDSARTSPPVPLVDTAIGRIRDALGSVRRKRPDGPPARARAR